jgi:hypothetical protein
LVVARDNIHQAKVLSQGQLALLFGLVWFGLVWFGLVWFGLVWFGLVWFAHVPDYTNDERISDCPCGTRSLS